MTDEIEQRLRNLHLKKIAAIVDDELAHADKQDLSYSAFLARLLRAQYHHRQETALAWRIKQARLPEQWTIESFPFKRQPGVNPKQIRALAELEFVAKAENIVLVGQTGVGTTGLASGLLLKAIQNGSRARFIRAQDLFDEMYASLADRSTRRLLNSLIRIDVLHIDELGYLNLKPEQPNIFFKLMEERYRRRPTIITTNLDYPEWQTFLGNKALVDALLSRLRHQCHTIRIDGPSLREPQADRPRLLPPPGHGRCRRRGRQERAHRGLQNARTRFAQRPRPSSLSPRKDKRPRSPPLRSASPNSVFRSRYQILI